MSLYIVTTKGIPVSRYVSGYSAYGTAGHPACVFETRAAAERVRRHLRSHYFRMANRFDPNSGEDMRKAFTFWQDSGEAVSVRSLAVDTAHAEELRLLAAEETR